MSFGLTLRLLRVDSGLSLRGLARQIGVSSAYLSRVENGHDPAPTPDRLAAIAGAIDVSFDMLLELAHQTGAALSEYMDEVPAANAFFLEVARRRLDAPQLARLRDVMEAEFNVPAMERGASFSNVIGGRIVLGLQCSTMDEVIVAGTASCVTGSNLSAADIEQRIRKREGEAPTALGKGVVVPHAVVEGASTTVSLVTVAGGLPISGPDAEPISAAFLMISGAGGHAHLELLARIARLAERDVARKLESVSSPAVALQVIEAIEGR